MTGDEQFSARRSSVVRCAFCHGAAEGATVCSGCGTLMHDDCRSQSGGCVTLGCARGRSAIVPASSLAFPLAPLRTGPRSRSDVVKVLISAAACFAGCFLGALVVDEDNYDLLGHLFFAAESDFRSWSFLPSFVFGLGGMVALAAAGLAVVAWVIQVCFPPVRPK